MSQKWKNYILLLPPPPNTHTHTHTQSELWYDTLEKWVCPACIRFSTFSVGATFKIENCKICSISKEIFWIFQRKSFNKSKSIFSNVEFGKNVNLITHLLDQSWGKFESSHFQDGCTPLALAKTVTILNISVIYWNYINHVSAIYVPSVLYISPLYQSYIIKSRPYFSNFNFGMKIQTSPILS